MASSSYLKSFFPHFILGGQDCRTPLVCKNKTKQAQLCRGSARHAVCHTARPTTLYLNSRAGDNNC